MNNRSIGYFRGLTRKDLISQIYKIWSKKYKNITKDLINSYDGRKLKAIWLGL